MLAALRRFIGTWPARAFFVVLVGSFGLWGVAGSLRGVGSDDGSSVATVGGRKIDVAELQDAARRLMSEMIRRAGGKLSPTPEIRREVAEQALQQLVVHAAYAVAADRLHLSVPDEALRRAIYSDKAFQGLGGQFDRAAFGAALRNNGFTEQRYLALLRTALGESQLVESVRAGAAAPDALARMMYQAEGETRTADLVSLPFAAAAEPPAPTPEQLQRQYADMPEPPPMRRISVVVLSPDSVARGLNVTDDQAHTYYEQHKAEFDKPEQRSVQVIVATSKDAATSMATAWISGADWEAMQKVAEASHASAVELEDTAQAAFPVADLAAAVFAAVPEDITGPVQTAEGWDVFRVTGVTRPTDDLKARVAQEQATDLVYDRQKKLEDTLAAGTPLDKLPPDLGLAAVTGTLDATGTTPDGTPAPIPGSPALRQAVIARAFQVAPGDPVTLEDGPDHSFYAVSVEAVLPPAKRPLSEIADAVRDDWLRDARRHEQDVAATALLAAVQDGATLADAARAAGQAVQRTPPVGQAASPLLPPQVARALFATALGKPAMVEAAQGFWVLVPAEVQHPDPAADPAAVAALRQQLAGAEGNDLVAAYAAALGSTTKVTVNRRLLDSVTQP